MSCFKEKKEFSIFLFNFFNMLHILCLFSEQRLKRLGTDSNPVSEGPGPWSTSSALNKHVKRNHGKSCPGETGSPAHLQSDCSSDHVTTMYTYCNPDKPSLTLTLINHQLISLYPSYSMISPTDDIESPSYDIVSPSNFIESSSSHFLSPSDFYHQV